MDIGPALPRSESAIPDWPAFYAASVGAAPATTLLHALARFDREGATVTRTALDLGCGAGRDTLELLRRDWRVIAIDREPAAFEGVRAVLPPEHDERLRTQVAPFERATWPMVDLVNASAALPFCEPLHFPSVWDRIVTSIREGGRFAGQFFGDHDEWAGVAGRTHHSRREVLALLADFELELLEEREFNGATRRGHPKHWHIFNVVAQR